MNDAHHNARQFATVSAVVELFGIGQTAEGVGAWCDRSNFDEGLAKAAFHPIRRKL